MKRTLLTLALCTLPLSAFAGSTSTPELTEYYTTSDNAYSIDKSTIKAMKDGNILAWVSWKFGVPADFGGVSKMGIKMIANCEENTLKSVEAIAYDADDKVKATEVHNNPLVVAPNTANLATYEVICANKPEGVTVAEVEKPKASVKKAHRKR